MTQSQTDKRVVIRKDDGDHQHSWALFIDGRMKWNGMSRTEAQWRKRDEIKKLKGE